VPILERSLSKLSGLDQGMTQCPILDVVLEQVLRVSEQ